ncbi:MAG TPA: ammonium transporter [Gammaproteobacteria bacterium]|nr:ammonium transporter [Gammaproteobacteria bacterium]
MKTLRKLLPALSGVGLLLPELARAQSIDSGDTAWIMTSTALVLFMTLPGLALFYGGLVRSKNVLSVLMQCFAVCCVVSIVWFVVGYSMAFSGTALNGLVGGFSKAFLSGIGLDSGDGIPETVFVMFQLTFAIITPALIVGGFAERMRFPAMLLFTILWVIVVYFPVTHWVWASDGWLNARGFRDFAGGAVVHVNAGVAALVAAVVLRNRKGFPDEPMPPHNLTMTVAGASMLWVGWFGFNGGSALAAGGAAGMAILVTHISAAAGSLAWMGMEWVRFGKPSVLGIVTGMVAGLGTITPASGFVGPAGALVIGFVAGVVCFLATQFLKRKLRIDDSLDVFPVHGVGGFIGLLMTAPFSVYLGGVSPLADGQTVGGQLLVQLTGAVATVAWCGIATFVLLKLIGIVSPLRASEDDERQGLDLTQHEERGYIL